MGRRGTALMASACVGALAACGTTVPLGAQRALGPDGLSPSSGAARTSPGQPGAPSPAESLGSAPGIRPSLSPVPSGLPDEFPSADPGADGPGITPTQIFIGAAYNPAAQAEDQALGVAGLDPGDTRLQYQAVVDYVNAHGGVAHRKLHLIWYRSDSSRSASENQQGECATWTSDHRSFVLRGGVPILDECTAKARAVALVAGETVIETSPAMQRYPMLVNIGTLTIDQGMAVTIEGLAHQNFLQGRVGIATYDDLPYHYGITHAVLPALARLGIRNVPIEYVASPTSVADYGSTSASVTSAILKFQQRRIDHVILLDGPSGAQASGLLTLFWMNQAYAQQWYPKYGLNSGSGLSALAGELPAREQKGAVGVGWMPTVDLRFADFMARPMPPLAKTCLKIMGRAGEQPTNANQLSLEFSFCDLAFFMQQALGRVRGALNQDSALEAIDGMGTSFQAIEALGTHIAHGRHTGASKINDVIFDSACTCYRYVGHPYAIG